MARRDQRQGLLDRIERLGNALPDPAFIFLALIGLLVLASVAASAGGWSAVSPATGETVVVRSLVSEENLAKLLTGMPGTLTAFPPLGLILAVMLGAAVAERSGLFAAAIGGAMRQAPRRALTPAVFVIGVASHHASDAAYVVLIPLAAAAYAQAGRHPLLGVAVAYAGISGAFAGNFVPGQFDVLILGITQAAARLVDPSAALNPLGNWWFTAALGAGLLPVAWFVADRIVEPRLGSWARDGDAAALAPVTAAAGSDAGPAGGTDGSADPAQAARQGRGLRRAGVAALAVTALFAALALWPGYTPLVDEDAGTGAAAPFFQSLIAYFLMLFLICGWVYGAATGTIRSHRDVTAMMTEGLRSATPFIVIAFFAAHFIAMFQWSGLGPVLAVRGAGLLQAADLPVPLLLSALLGVTSALDWLIGSASAKWSALAPVVVPMLMLVGISPEMTTAAFRMGDSVWNIVTPVSSNFVLVLALAQRWAREFGIGSLIALMLPFSLAFGLFGLALVVMWSGLGWPVGPGAPAHWTAP